MAVVHLATDRDTGESVAVMLLDQDMGAAAGAVDLHRAGHRAEYGRGRHEPGHGQIAGRSVSIHGEVRRGTWHAGNMAGIEWRASLRERVGSTGSCGPRIRR